VEDGEPTLGGHTVDREEALPRLIKEQPRQWVHKMSFQLVTNTSPTIREISQTQFSQLIQNCITQLDLAAAGLLHPGQNGGDQYGVDLFSDIGSDEIEDDDVLSDPVQKLWPAKIKFEIAVNLGCHLCLHIIKVIIFRGIGHPFIIGIKAIDAKV
jgi:hypothetical protein